MPQANIWIKKENWEAWQQSNKSDWINNLLEHPMQTLTVKDGEWSRTTAKPAISDRPKPIKVEITNKYKQKEIIPEELTYEPNS